FRVAARLLAAFALVVLVPAAALGADTLRVLAWPGYADPDVVKAFERRHDVRVQVTIVGSDEMLWDRVSAHDGADYDVFAVNTAELKRYLDRALVVPLDLTRIPNVAQQQPRFRDRFAIPNLMRDGAVYAVPY